MFDQEDFDNDHIIRIGHYLLCDCCTGAECYCDGPDAHPDGLGGDGTVHFWPYYDPETGKGIYDFSWHDCDACGTSLGGSRHRHTILERN